MFHLKFMTKPFNWMVFAWFLSMIARDFVVVLKRPALCISWCLLLIPVSWRSTKRPVILSISNKSPNYLGHGFHGYLKFPEGFHTESDLVSCFRKPSTFPSDPTVILTVWRSPHPPQPILGPLKNGSILGLHLKRSWWDWQRFSVYSVISH